VDICMIRTTVTVPPTQQTSIVTATRGGHDDHA
jgi:hypothetical protein